MVKKLQKLADKKAAPAAGLLDSQLAQTVKDSAQQIWLAGLGAFAKAQGEGTKVFETLIKEGTSLHRKTQAAADEKLGDVAGKMSAMAGQMGDKANSHWDKLESIFEERTARALGKLGMPSAKEVAALTERVAALEAALAGERRTSTFGAGAATKPPSKPPMKSAKPARKATARKRSAAAATPATPMAESPDAKPAKPAAKRTRKPAAA